MPPPPPPPPKISALPPPLTPTPPISTSSSPNAATNADADADDPPPPPPEEEQEVPISESKAAKLVLQIKSSYNECLTALNKLRNLQIMSSVEDMDDTAMASETQHLHHKLQLLRGLVQSLKVEIESSVVMKDAFAKDFDQCQLGVHRLGLEIANL
jgi:hypothetical protein